MTKTIVEGKPCKMVCHMYNVENNLGRSTVVDLNSSGANRAGFRQVDHRSIEFIIFKNVKYVLRKGSKTAASSTTNDTDADMDKKKEDVPKWNRKEL